MREIRDERADRPGSANGTLRAMRPLFTWAKSAGHISINPATDVRQLSGSIEGWHAWTDDEVARFEAAHPVGTMARLAFALSLAIEFDCYLIDEIILVGDQNFQRKCDVEFFEKRSDRTMVIASHSLEFIKNFCTKAILIHQGNATIYDDVNLALDDYTHL